MGVLLEPVKVNKMSNQYKNFEAWYFIIIVSEEQLYTLNHLEVSPFLQEKHPSLTNIGRFLIIKDVSCQHEYVVLV